MTPPSPVAPLILAPLPPAAPPCSTASLGAPAADAHGAEAGEEGGANDSAVLACSSAGEIDGTNSDATCIASIRVLLAPSLVSSVAAAVNAAASTASKPRFIMSAL